MDTKSCKFCGKTFTKKPHWSLPQFKRRIFCCNKCKKSFFKSQKIFHKCKICDKKFQFFPSFKKKNRGFYCSMKCYGIDKVGHPSWNKGKHIQCNTGRTHFKKGDNSGKKNWNWKGGIKKTSQGYIMLYRPNHPFGKGRAKQYILRSRLVMEKYLGRYLKPTEIVHHINRIKDDDRIENLELFINKSKHTKFHMILRYK